MSLDASLHRLIGRIADAPGVRQLRRHRYNRVFDHNPGMNLFRGVYPSFEAAAAAIPADDPGFDNEAAARLYESWLRPFENDYPALFWLQRSITDGQRSICDLGGNIGFKYVAFSEVLSFPEGTTWTVIDLPAIISRGRQFAVEKRATNALRFTPDLAAIDGHDVLFASGSLQYLPKRLPELLSGLEALPQRLILNLTAVHPALAFYTVNSFGSGFAAYRIEARNALVADVEAAGYHLRDEWKCVNKPFHMPLTPELDFDSYSGFCFDRVPAHD